MRLSVYSCLIASTLIGTSSFANPVITCNERGCSDHGVAASSRNPQNIKNYNEDGVRFLTHPQGCPKRLFCGCGASVDIFGKSVRHLWLSSNWFKFPRTSPAPNMVAVRNGHVFVLKQRIEGNNWLVNDYNSGGHKSRQWIRSIAGYRIVNPHGSYTSN